MNRVTLIVTGAATAAILGLGALALSYTDSTPSPVAPAPDLSAQPASPTEDDGCGAYRARGIACEAIAFEPMEITADPNPGHELATTGL